MQICQTGPGRVPKLREVSDQDLPKPDSCRLAGLECRPCVQNTAANLASVCQDLSLASLRDSFFKIYPDPACLAMSRVFARAYRSTQKHLTTDASAGEEADDFLSGDPA